MLELDRMAIFAEVAESGSFTAAGARLGLPKSTVSLRVAQLESSLGVRLLQRSTRKLSLTDAGQIYLAHCQRMIDAAHSANAAVSLLRAEPAGLLRVTAPEASGIKVFAPLIGAFQACYPKVHVDFLVTDEPLDLFGRRIDVAFRTGKLIDSNLVCRKLAEVRRVLVAAPAYVERMGWPQHPAELASGLCLVHHPLPRWPFSRHAEHVQIEPQSVQTSNSLMFILHNCIDGAGFALLPAFLCQKELANETLVEILPDWTIPPNDYYMIHPSREHVSAALLAFRSFVEDSDIRQLLTVTPRPAA